MEALINAMVHDCVWNFAQNQGKKHSNTSSIASIFNDEFGQNNNAGVSQGINQCFPKETEVGSYEDDGQGF
jgi:hypothetical protein